MENKIKKILVLEDEKPLARALELKLTHEGFDVKTSSNGEEGLNLALKEYPDLILVDILMPKMNGLNMLKEIRKDDWGKTVPFIILTNINEVNQISQAMSLLELDGYGSFEYFIKSNTQISDIITSIKNKLQ